MAADDLTRVLADIDDLLPAGAPDRDDDPELSPDAMRWSPVEEGQHPDQAPPMRHVRRYDDLPDDYPTPARPNSHRGYAETTIRRGQFQDALLRAVFGYPAGYPVPAWLTTAVAAHTPPDWSGYGEQMADAAERAQQTATEFLQTHYGALHPRRDILGAFGLPQHTSTGPQHTHTAAQAVIEARRNRNTGPNNPQGADGRARRRHRPRRAAAPHATPARTATQRLATPPSPAVHEIAAARQVRLPGTAGVGELARAMLLHGSAVLVGPAGRSLWLTQPGRGPRSVLVVIDEPADFPSPAPGATFSVAAGDLPEAWQ